MRSRRAIDPRSKIRRKVANASDAGPKAPQLVPNEPRRIRGEPGKDGHSLRLSWTRAKIIHGICCDTYTLLFPLAFKYGLIIGADAFGVISFFHANITRRRRWTSNKAHTWGVSYNPRSKSAYTNWLKELYFNVVVRLSYRSSLCGVSGEHGNRTMLHLLLLECRIVGLCAAAASPVM